jgi:hypothetical protein
MSSEQGRTMRKCIAGAAIVTVACFAAGGIAFADPSTTRMGILGIRPSPSTPTSNRRVRTTRTRTGPNGRSTDDRHQRQDPGHSPDCMWAAVLVRDGEPWFLDGALVGMGAALVVHRRIMASASP